MNFHQLLLAPDLPVASMVCPAANVNDGTDGLKSTDVLVAQNAIRITSAQQLAGQSFSQYWRTAAATASAAARRCRRPIPA